MKRLIIDILRYINRFGILNGIQVLLKKNLAVNNEIIISIPSIRNKIYIRKGTSDWPTFEQIFLFNEYEHDILCGINPNFIIDAGANVGYASVFFASKFPDAKIVSIEPEKSNFDLLVKNTKDYKNIDCIQSALWNKEGFLQFKDCNVGNWSFQLEEYKQLGNSETKIQATTISKILDIYKIDCIDILKIDIEGAEKQLFSYDFEGWINKVKILFIELHDRKEIGCSKAFYSTITKYDFDQYNNGENIIIRFK
jgi:FkbM family methyltransferase